MHQVMKIDIIEMGESKQPEESQSTTQTEADISAPKFMKNTSRL